MSDNIYNFLNPTQAKYIENNAIFVTNELFQDENDPMGPSVLIGLICT